MTPITKAPHVIASSYMSVSGEMLPQALEFLHWCGAFLRGVTIEAVTYRVEFCHPEFEGRQAQLLFHADKGRGKFTAEINDLGPASCDTQPKAGDDFTAPLGSGAVGEAETPEHSPSPPPEILG
jgi:hypothetical protein